MYAWAFSFMKPYFDLEGHLALGLFLPDLAGSCVEILTTVHVDLNFTTCYKMRLLSLLSYLCS